MTFKSYEYLNFMKVCEIKIYRLIQENSPYTSVFIKHFLNSYKLLIMHEENARSFGLNLPCSSLAIPIVQRLEENLNDVKTPLTDELDSHFSKSNQDIKL